MQALDYRVDALTLAKRSKPLEISHLCHACRDDLCLEVKHFEIEPGPTNTRRTKHQNGNEVCNCVEFGDQPCMSNSTIGEKIFNNEGVYVGWKRAERKGGKRIKK